MVSSGVEGTGVLILTMPQILFRFVDIILRPREQITEDVLSLFQHRELYTSWLSLAGDTSVSNIPTPLMNRVVDLFNPLVRCSTILLQHCYEIVFESWA